MVGGVLYEVLFVDESRGLRVEWWNPPDSRPYSWPLKKFVAFMARAEVLRPPSDSVGGIA